MLRLQLLIHLVAIASCLRLLKVKQLVISMITPIIIIQTAVLVLAMGISHFDLTICCSWRKPDCQLCPMIAFHWKVRLRGGIHLTIVQYFCAINIRLNWYIKVNLDRSAASMVLRKLTCHYFVLLLFLQSIFACVGKQCSFSTTSFFKFYIHPVGCCRSRVCSKQLVQSRIVNDVVWWALQALSSRFELATADLAARGTSDIALLDIIDSDWGYKWKRTNPILELLVHFVGVKLSIKSNQGQELFCVQFPIHNLRLWTQRFPRRT